MAEQDYNFNLDEKQNIDLDDRDSTLSLSSDDFEYTLNYPIVDYFGIVAQIRKEYEDSLVLKNDYRTNNNYNIVDILPFPFPWNHDSSI